MVTIANKIFDFLINLFLKSILCIKTFINKEELEKKIKKLLNIFYLRASNFGFFFFPPKTVKELVDFKKSWHKNQCFVLLDKSFGKICDGFSI